MPDDTTHIISLGAGVQSTVMLLMACDGLLEPMPKAAIFADTGWEPADVYLHLDWLETVSTIPIIRTSNGRNLYDDTWAGVAADGHVFTDIPVFAMKSDGTMNMAKRQCTVNYKITPIRRELRRVISRPSGVRNGPQAVQWCGITTDEAHRMKDSGVGYVENRYPLIERNMNRLDCLAWFRERYPGRPLVKSSCVGCPFHSDAEWVRLMDADPDGIKKAIALDERLRSPDRPQNPNTLRLPEFLHRKGPLRDVLTKLKRIADEGQQLSMFDGFGNECEGHCGV